MGPLKSIPLDPRGWLAAIIDSSEDAIVSKTLEGIVTTWNRGAERIFGYTAEEMIGSSILKIIPQDRQHEEPQILARIARGERIEHFETVRQRKDGRLIDISVTISPVRDENNRIVGASKIARDITADRQARRDLVAANAAFERARQAAEIARTAAESARRDAETANSAKDNFLGVLSHELRTPLTPALLAVQMIESDTTLPAETREQLAMVRRNLETEAHLVDDLLDLTRITRGKLSLHFEVVDTHATLRNVLAMFHAEIERKSLNVSLHLAATQYSIWADAGRFQQVLLNLLSNAVKFTPSGGSIELGTENRGGRLEIHVTDTGIGIEPQLGSRLFRAFEQGDRSVARRFGGLGLGLSIVKSLLVLHQGGICYSSAGKDQGTTFTVDLPLTAEAEGAPAGGAATPAEKDRPGPRVLLVEDHSDTREVMVLLLRRLRCSVVAAGSVREATALAARDRFDLLICDFGLPDGSGADVLQQVRRLQPLRAIAMTGFGQEEDLKRSRDAGFEIHLTKPVNVAELAKAIEQAVAA